MMSIIDFTVLIQEGMKMKKLSREAFEEIRFWVYRNARQIELAIWEFEFEGGGCDAVLSALGKYQNADGGFGNALEPDCWNPASSPYTTLNAISRLKTVGFTDVGHPIYQGIIRYLDSGEHRTDSGWLFNIPSNNGFARAPWWTYDAKANEHEHLGVTAGLVCFILQYVDNNAPLYNLAFAFAEKLLARFNEPGQKGDMGLGGYSQLLDVINQLGLAGRLDISRLSSELKRLVDDAIERDESKWGEYRVRPSQFIKSPDSPYYADNEGIVQAELDYLIDTRPVNGVWNISWHWHDNYAKYPEEFAISKNWWKADLVVDRIKFLRNFNRLE